MSAGRRVTRRRLLAVAGVTVVGAAAAGTVKLVRDDEPAGSEALTRHVADAFSDDDSAKKVGAAYLRSNPRENDERRLVRLLEKSNGDWPRMTGKAEIRRLAREQARRDYRRGRLAVVEGWYLSQTEARLCALTTFA